MKEQVIDWDALPDILSKDQFYRICHISKSTALFLLKSGIVPSENTGKKTRCYRIKKEDVKTYLENRAIFPDTGSAPRGWYGTHYKVSFATNLCAKSLKNMEQYYKRLLANCKDVLTTLDIVQMTGYSRTTVNNWCTRNWVKHFYRGRTYYIPKVFLIEFFCSLPFRSITRKSAWHISVLRDFHAKYAMSEVTVKKIDGKVED